MTLYDHSFPVSWTVTKDSPSPRSITLQQTYPDGTDVLILITPDVDGHKITTSVECRTSGPVETHEGVFSDADVVEAVEKLCSTFDSWNN